MKKVFRCTEMIQRSATKLLQASESNHFSPSSSISSSSSDPQGGINGVGHKQHSSSVSKDSSLLASSHRSHLTRAGNDVAMATQTLIDMIRKRLSSHEDGSGAKSKRMLPATPRAMASRPITPKSFLPQSTRPPLLRAKSASQNRNKLVRNSWHTFDAHTGSGEL